MVDYSKLSDFEINSAVHNALLKKPYALVFMGDDQIAWTSENGDQIITEKVPYTKNGVHDYCNNPADAWPIIVDNHITISHLICTWSVTALVYDKKFENGFFIFKSDSDIGDISSRGALRAAMIVFLMMQDAKNG